MIEAAIRAIRNARPRRVVFFTGAGISADSGVPTFRVATPPIVDAILEA
jgi:NAD-dependent SIR2 family protein deacetylase